MQEDVIRACHPHRRHDGECGFTFLELPAILGVIGILVAITAPMLLAQRQRGYDAQAESDLRHVARMEEAFLNRCNYYAGAVSSTNVEGSCKTGITDYRPSANVTGLTVRTVYDADGGVASDSPTAGTTSGMGGFCLQATSRSGKLLFYDNTRGGLLPTATGTCTPRS